MGETQEVKPVTREWLREQKACYDDEQIAALVSHEGMTLLDALRCDCVSAADRVWVATRPGALDPAVLRRWLGRLVRRALGRVDSPDPRSLAVLQYLDAGEEVPDDVREGARAASLDARPPARDARAAWAAWASAWAASAASACDAYAATTAAADYACSANAEREQQVADLIELL